MKFNKLLFLLFLTITAVSCKDETKGKENSEVTPEEIISEANSFKVTLNLVAKNDDDFCLLYTNDGSLNFNEGIWKGVKGSGSGQLVDFTLPKDVFPTQLRLDLGKNQDEVLLKSIKFEYNGNIREIKGGEVGVFFRADASKCSYDVTMGIIKPIVKDGKKEPISLYPNESILASELPRLAN